MPLLDSTLIEKIELYVPSEILPSGIKQLAVLALEHPNNQDNFLVECYRTFDIYIDEMYVNGRHTDAEYFWGIISAEDDTCLINIGLTEFYHRFIAQVNQLLRMPNFKLTRLISLRVNNAICVELKWPQNADSYAYSPQVPDH